MAQSLNSFEPLLPLLEHRPLGVFSDIDGTLAPIVPRSEDARLSTKCRDLLIALVEGGARVALITGRTLEDARGTADIDGAAFGASHGLELFVDGKIESRPDVEPYVEAARSVLKETRGLRVDGLIVEDKGPIVAFHYRNSLNEWAARAAILDAIGRSPAAERFVIQEGRKVLELRPPLDINKGSALLELADRLEVRSLICLGDDRTDIDMFQAAVRLREEGAFGATVAVRSSEIAPEVLDAADYVVDGVSGVEWLLGELVSALR